MSTLSPPEEGRLRNSRPLVPLRVLYTLNTSPQYLLARQRRAVPVVPIIEGESNERTSAGLEQVGSSASKPRFAKVSLRTCLEAVCKASPELVCDRSRDYSVYVVDPLETPPSEENSLHGASPIPTDGSVGTASPCPWGECVSIGMGLMSWCLAENEDVSSGAEDVTDEGYVVGKFLRDRGTDAVEIIMSLRQTITQTQHQHALSLSSWGLPAPSTITTGASVSATPLPSPAHASAQPMSVQEESQDKCPPEVKKDSTAQIGPFSASGFTDQPDEQPSRAKLKKIGRPQGAKTHPEKRARQLAIQMHKEKLERLHNIMKMQNGEKYDKTLIIASECETKVTEEIIAREQKLLEELQSRPLIVDGPRFTTQPLLRRASSPTTQNPLVEKGAPKRRKKASTNAVASGSSTIRSETIVEGACSESTQFSTKEERDAGILLSLLSSVLGKVDDPAAAGATGDTSLRLANEKGKAKETHQIGNEALAHALQTLLPYLPSHANQPNVHSTTTSPGPSANTQVSAVVHRGGDLQVARPTPHLRSSYPSFFQTAEESFCPKPERGPNWPNDRHWTTKSAPSKAVPKVREDAHPVPGGGWARGKHIVPRATAPSQLESTSSDNTRDTDAVTRSSTSATIAELDKENMPPTKPKRGLKRSFSSSGDAKENATPKDALVSKNGPKKRKQDDTARHTKSKATNRAMMGSAATNEVPSRTIAASSPVRSKTPTSPHRSLPVVAASEPDFFLPRLVGPPLIASSISQNSSPGPSRTLPKSDRPSDELDKPVISHTVSPTDPPKTPPRSKRSFDNDTGGSLFTPYTTSTSGLAEALSRAPSSPSPILANSARHTSERPSLAEAEVEYREGATLASRHVGTGWDLPPSSPPPPTSPILPDNDIDQEENHMDWDLAMQLQSELDVEMEKTGMDMRFEDYGTTVTSAVTSTPAAGVLAMEDDGSPHQLSAFEAVASDFDPSSDDIFNLEALEQLEHGQQPDVGDETELDIDELWSSLGPVIAQAQVDVGSNTENEFGFYDLASDQTFGDPEEQGAVDPIRLADDLKALFGGCVV